MAGKIFINYRRGDDPGFTQALYQRLEAEFAAGNLFMDVEGHIKPGDDFVEVLSAQVAAADVMLAVIGPRWAELLIAREGDRDDFVAKRRSNQAPPRTTRRLSVRGVTQAVPSAGEIKAVGSEVTGLKPGDRIMAGPRRSDVTS
jgi:TIR domain